VSSSTYGMKWQIWPIKMADHPGEPRQKDSALPDSFGLMILAL